MHETPLTWLNDEAAITWSRARPARISFRANRGAWRPARTRLIAASPAPRTTSWSTARAFPEVPDAVLHHLAEDLRQLPDGPARLAGLEAAGFKRRPTFPVESLADASVHARVEQALGALLLAEAPTSA